MSQIRFRPHNVGVPHILRAPLIVWLFLYVVCAAAQQPPAAKPDINYGQNAAAGTYISINGIKMYVETYGSGSQPLLVIHGNGGSIADMKNQITYFSARYQVIGADSRGQGKSEMGKGRLTFEQMAEDLNALLEQRSLKSVFVLGWSDGGIIGLLLAIHHPDKVSKLAILGANLVPAGLYDWVREWIRGMDHEADSMIAKRDKSQPWEVTKQLCNLMGKQPNIPLTDLRKIMSPTLVMAGDKDAIRTEHTVQIFENLPHAHLCIFPGSTHFILQENPTLFNATVSNFFEKPYLRPDTKDVLK